ncbi:MAG: acetolactate decarboxylase [Kiritimatiellales bacterium]|nr:acetolactate decarboxylase [Kiritimatiellales bacterium]
MRKTAALTLLVFTMTGCATAPRNTVTQISTIDALLVGAYDGQMTCRELLRHGGFGLGTFDHLDGEMIVLDGKVYQAKSSGEIAQPTPNITTPFASVVAFKADKNELVASKTDFQALEKQVDGLAPNKNLFCAVKVTGVFPKMKVRAIPAQQKPYPPLTEAAKVQPVFEYTDLTGTIVGFRCPAYVKGINVQGYHLHFISDDRTKGGHILDFQCLEGTLEIDVCNRFFMILPEGSGQFEQLDLSKDRSAELHKVEK